MTSDYQQYKQTDVVRPIIIIVFMDACDTLEIRLLKSEKLEYQRLLDLHYISSPLEEPCIQQRLIPIHHTFQMKTLNTF